MPGPACSGGSRPLRESEPAGEAVPADSGAAVDPFLRKRARDVLPLARANMHGGRHGAAANSSSVDACAWAGAGVGAGVGVGVLFLSTSSRPGRSSRSRSDPERDWPVAPVVVYWASMVRRTSALPDPLPPRTALYSASSTRFLIVDAICSANACRKGEDRWLSGALRAQVG